MSVDVHIMNWRSSRTSTEVCTFASGEKDGPELLECAGNRVSPLRATLLGV